MSIENLYTYASGFIFIPWLMMMFAPNRRYTEPLAFFVAIVLLLAGIYYTIQLIRLGSDSGTLLSLSGILNFFRSNEMLLTAWFNYLSISLLAGIWQNRDSATLKIPHIWVLPCLLITFISGPVGILIYLLIRRVQTNKKKTS
jgi:hypothetical protein